MSSMEVGSFPTLVGQLDVELEVTYCVGGVISPLLANIFLHLAFDQWMRETFPGDEEANALLDFDRRAPWSL